MRRPDLKELKNQGYLPGVPSATDITITTGQKPALELKDLQHPFVSTFSGHCGGRFVYQSLHRHASDDGCALAVGTGMADGRGGPNDRGVAGQFSPPISCYCLPWKDLTNLAAMQDEVSSHQAIRGPLMHELRAATRFLTELGRTGRLPGMFAHHGHEQVTTDTLPFKALEYPFAATFCVDEVGESFTDHYTLAQSAKGAPWQLQRAWRTDARGRTVKEWTVTTNEPSSATVQP